MRESCDILVNNGLVLTMDKGMSIIENGSVAVRRGRIVGVGPGHRMRDAFRPGESIDAKGGIVMPGMVNTHAHAAMALFRGYADDLRMEEWLRERILPAESRYVSPRTVRLGTRLAIAEMIMSGTTTFNDMYMFEEETARAAREAGMRAVVGEVLYDFPSASIPDPGKSMAFTERFIRRWKDDPLINVSVSPHSPYMCSPGMLRECRELADRYGTQVHTHVAETAKEVSESVKKTGKPPVEYLDGLGVLHGGTLAAHCVHLNGKEIRLLAERKAGVSHNPKSNMKLASGVAPAPDLLAAGAAVGLGTSGSASNNDLNMFREMSTAARLHKVFRGDATAMGARAVMGMATIGGARALGMDDEIGSLEPGKRADMIILDTERPHAVPMYSPYSTIVYSLNGSEVRDVLVNGRPVMTDRKLRTIGLDGLLREARDFGREIVLDGISQGEPNYVGNGELRTE